MDHYYLLPSSKLQTQEFPAAGEAGQEILPAERHQLPPAAGLQTLPPPPLHGLLHDSWYNQVNTAHLLVADSNSANLAVRLSVCKLFVTSLIR